MGVKLMGCKLCFAAGAPIAVNEIEFYRHLKAFHSIRVKGGDPKVKRRRAGASRQKDGGLVFTDANAARMKEISQALSWTQNLALLHRLECAEAALRKHTMESHECDEMDAWLKSCGRSK